MDNFASNFLMHFPLAQISKRIKSDFSQKIVFEFHFMRFINNKLKMKNNGNYVTRGFVQGIWFFQNQG